MKTTLTTILALVVISSPALMAEEGGRNKGERGGDFHKKMMEKYDADKDGKLSETERAEAKKGHEARREEMKARHEEMKTKFDTDKDGKLSPEERKAAFEAQLASGDLPEHVMKRIDKDGDGKVSEEERAAMRKHHEGRRGEMEERRAKMLEKCDTDGDGKVSEEERAACKKKRQAERGGEGKSGHRKGDKPGRPDSGE